MTRRPRMDDDLFEFLDEKKEHPNQGIGEVLRKEYPEIEEELTEKEKDKKKESFLLEDNLF